MNAALIRTAEFSDLPYLYEICLKTGASGKDATEFYKNPYMLGQYYAANYLFFEQDLFIVATVGEEGHSSIPQGYCIGCSDTVAYSNWMNSEWLPQLKKQFPLSYTAKTDVEKHLLNTIHRKYEFGAQEWAKKYSAHLHIDLLPSLQGSGCGRKLLEELFERLRKKNVSGVHLGVDSKNENAIGFYKKIGFFELEKAEWGYILGYDL